jgi:WD40 repeat protein
VYRFTSFAILGWLVVSAALVAAEQGVATDVAVLELDLPSGAKVVLNGKDYGTRRHFRYPGWKPGERYFFDLRVQFPDGKEEKRTMILQGGWLVRLPLLAPESSGPELFLQTGHTSSVYAVAFSPDGEHVLTGSVDRTAILWDVRTGQSLRAFQGHTGDVFSVMFSQDGKRILTGSTDSTAILWDVRTGQRLRRFLGHTAAVWSASFSSDGRHALTGSWDRTAILWDTATGQKLRTFQGHAQVATSVTFSPDGRHVLTGSWDQTAILWDAATGQRLHTLQGHTGWVNAVAFSPDSKQVLTGSVDRTAALWDVGAGRKLRTFRGHTLSVRSVAFSPDGSQVLTGSLDRTAILWDVRTSQRLRTFQGHSSPVTSVAFSPDGEQAVTGTDRTAILWQVQTGRKLRTLYGSSNPVYSVAFGPDGEQVVTGSWDRTASLWAGRTGQKLRTFKGHTNCVMSVAFSRSGQHVLTGSLDNAAILWDAQTGQRSARFQGHTGHVRAAAFGPDYHQVLTGSDDGTAMLWDTDTGRRLRKFHGRSGNVHSVAFSPDGNQVLTGAIDSTAILWEARTGERLRTFKGHTALLTSVAFSPDGKHVLTGSYDTTAILWQAQTGQRLRALRGHTGWVHSVAFSRDGKLVLTGSADNTAILWDVSTGKRLRQFQAHNSSVHSAAFSPEGRHVLTGSQDGTARLWDVATGNELARLITLDGGQDWAVVTPEGLFDGSKGGRENVAFRLGKGLDVVPLDRFFQDFYYPGLLAELWRGERPMPGKSLGTNPAPTLKMLVHQDAGATKGQATIDVAVTDQGGGIKGPWLQHNGATLRTDNKLRQEGKTGHYRFPVTLVPGNNRIEVRAATANGSRESDPVSHTVAFNGQLPEPQLHVIAIGINRHAQGSGVSNLDFCLSDAKAMADLFRKSSGKLYQQVHVTQLFDDQATKEGIVKAVAAMAAKARPQDTLVLYVASHGIALGQRFYLIPHDFQLAKGEAAPEVPKAEIALVATRGYRSITDAREAAVRARGLAIDELGEALAAVPALKRVLIFDTCHSGSAIALAGKKQNPFAFRGAMERFSRAQGVYSLAATAADELAAENKELGHSILTYALLAGLRAVERGPLQGQALKGGERGAVDVLAWFRYARQQVPGLYERYVGRPQQVELSGEDQPGFPLLRLDAK